MSILLHDEWYSATSSFELVWHQFDSLNYFPFPEGWLGYDKASNKLVIATTANQDPLFATTGLVPILGIDVWEHAYYLDVSHVNSTSSS